MDIIQPLDLFDEGTSLGDATLDDSDNAKAETRQEEKDSAVVSGGDALEEQTLNEECVLHHVTSEATLIEESKLHNDEKHEPPAERIGLDGNLESGIIELKTMTGKMSVQLEELSQLFSKRILHTEYEEKIVDQMHKELQKYKEDMYAQLVRPILMDIIEVRDSIMRIAAAYMDKPDGEQSIPNKTFSGYSFDLQDILEKNNVEIYRSTEGETFIPIKQRAVKKLSTSDQSLHGRIAESLSCGYNYEGRTISAEKVVVYYYEEPIKQENKENSEVD